MNRRAANLLRGLTVVVFVAVAIVAFRTFNPQAPQSVTEPGKSEIDVAQAVNGVEARPVTVRGHVFLGPGALGLRLCEGRQNTSPPTCLGPFLDLDGITEANFDLTEATSSDGPVRYVKESLALRGMVTGTRLAVSEVLR